MGRGVTHRSQPAVEQCAHVPASSRPRPPTATKRTLIRFVNLTAKHLCFLTAAAQPTQRTLELRWTGPRNRQRWNPCKEEDDGSRPNLHDATERADVSTKAGPSSLHWSRRSASIGTTSCPRYCFMVTLLRHRLDCFVFGRHRFVTFFLEQSNTVLGLDPFSDDHIFTEVQEMLCILISRHQCPRSRLPEIIDLCEVRHDLGAASFDFF